MKWITNFILSLSFLLSTQVGAWASLLPEYDKNCDALSIQALTPDSLLFSSLPYFEKRIPRTIHQIWFGSPTCDVLESHEIWSQYAAYFGYDYCLWTDADIPALKHIMSDENYILLNFLLSVKNYHSASDVLRMELISHYGGVYLDCDFSPPYYNESYFDIFEVIPNKGLVLMLEHKARDIGSQQAIFCANGFIAACPSHPVINACIAGLNDNVESWYKKHKNYNAMYCTGAFYLNRVLTGTFTVIPAKYLAEIGMVK
jgi:mannosyltransferase OCH1-like enzyme